MSGDSLCKVNRADSTRLRVRALRYDYFAKDLL